MSEDREIWFYFLPHKIYPLAAQNQDWLYNIVNIHMFWHFLLYIYNKFDKLPTGVSSLNNLNKKGLINSKYLIIRIHYVSHFFLIDYTNIILKQHKRGPTLSVIAFAQSHTISSCMLYVCFDE